MLEQFVICTEGWSCVMKLLILQLTIKIDLLLR